MPRPNRTRNVLAEDHLARRIAFERDARGWTNDGLAKRMTSAGCAMTGSAIFKIEKGEPRRRIVVDELVAFAQVFGLPVDHLLLPPELMAADEIADLLSSWNQAQDKAIAAQQDELEAWERVRTWFEGHPEYADKAEPLLRHWSEMHYEEGHDFRVARRMWELTDDPEWGQRAKTALDVLVVAGGES